MKKELLNISKMGMIVLLFFYQNISAQNKISIIDTLKQTKEETLKSDKNSGRTEKIPIHIGWINRSLPFQENSSSISCLTDETFDQYVDTTYNFLLNAQFVNASKDSLISSDNKMKRIMQFAQENQTLFFPGAEKPFRAFEKKYIRRNELISCLPDYFTQDLQRVRNNDTHLSVFICDIPKLLGGSQGTVYTDHTQGSTICLDRRVFNDPQSTIIQIQEIKSQIITVNELVHWLLTQLPGFNEDTKIPYKQGLYHGMNIYEYLSWNGSLVVDQEAGFMHTKTILREYITNYMNNIDEEISHKQTTMISKYSPQTQYAFTGRYILKNLETTLSNSFIDEIINKIHKKNTNPEEIITQIIEKMYQNFPVFNAHSDNIGRILYERTKNTFQKQSQ